MRSLIIGDIHGNYSSLNAILHKADYNPKNDRIICVGDYVDGWSQSFEVVDYLLSISEKAAFENIFIMGNHDKWFKSVLEEGLTLFRNEDYIRRKYMHWYEQDGRSTYHSYLAQTDADISRHKMHFFNHLKYYYKENNDLYLHAGFEPSVGFEQTLASDKSDLVFSRALYETALQYWKKERAQTINSDYFPVPGFQNIFIGHTPTVQHGIMQPVKMGNVINVDQGCKIDGRLSLWVRETEEYFQVSQERGEIT